MPDMKCRKSSCLIHRRYYRSPRGSLYDFSISTCGRKTENKTSVKVFRLKYLYPFVWTLFLLRHKTENRTSRSILGLPVTELQMKTILLEVAVFESIHIVKTSRNWWNGASNTEDFLILFLSFRGFVELEGDTCKTNSSQSRHNEVEKRNEDKRCLKMVLSLVSKSISIQIRGERPVLYPWQQRLKYSRDGKNRETRVWEDYQGKT